MGKFWAVLAGWPSPTHEIGRSYPGPMCYSYEQLLWIDEAAYYFRLHYAAQPFCRMRDTGHEWEILFAPGKGPKNPGPYWAVSLKQAMRWIDGYVRYHKHRLEGQWTREVSGKDPDEPWPWPNG